MTFEPPNGTFPSVVIAGHSHIFQMGAQQGYRGNIQIQPVPDNPRLSFLMEEWSGNRSPAYWDFLVENAPGKSIAVIYNGNQHNASFLLAADPPFDFWHPLANDNVVSGAVLIPYLMAAEFFRPSLRELDKFVERAKGAGAKKVVIVGTPPVKEDMSRYRDDLIKSDFFQGVAKRLGLDIETVAFTPATVRMKLWRVLQDLMADLAKEHDVAFLPVSSEACDESGFLHEKFYGKDATHANVEYGTLMLNHIDAFCR